jgi:hypothetical protein
MPEMFWNSLPPDQLQAWLKAHVPADMNDNVERGMQAVRFKVSEKAALVPAVDAYLASRARSG